MTFFITFAGMKRWLIIGLFVLLALAACVKDPEPVEGPTRKGAFSSELSAIDSLMWQWLDSVITKQGNLITLDVGNLDSGVYVYRVVSENGESMIGKFVKE